MRFEDKVGKRANKMLHDIAEALVKGKLCATVALAPDGTQVPYLCIVDSKDEEKGVLIPLGPMLGEFKYEFTPGSLDGEKAEVIEVKADLVSELGGDIPGSIGDVTGQPGKNFDEKTQYIFNSVCEAALRGRISCVNATLPDGTKQPYLGVAVEMDGVAATILPVGPITGKYVGDAKAPTSNVMNEVLMGPTPNVPDHLKKMARTRQGMPFHIDPKDIN